MSRHNIAANISIIIPCIRVEKLLLKCIYTCKRMCPESEIIVLLDYTNGISDIKAGWASPILRTPRRQLHRVHSIHVYIVTHLWIRDFRFSSDLWSVICGFITWLFSTRSNCINRLNVSKMLCDAAVVAAVEMQLWAATGPPEGSHGTQEAPTRPPGGYQKGARRLPELHELLKRSQTGLSRPQTFILY